MSEAKSMVTLKATVEVVDERYILKIHSGTEDIRIPISVDKPNEVKRAFNKLIQRLKEGDFQLELTGSGDDLFSHVAGEYVTQLNREILEVRTEMKQYGLIHD